jgi:thiol:disulfide interchange protein
MMKNLNLICFLCKLALASAILIGSSIAISAEATKSNANVDVSAELLSPSVAFKTQIRQRDAFTAELKFEIAPGYYLYRDRIRVERLHSAAQPTSAKKTSSLQNANKQTANEKGAAKRKAIAVNFALSKPDGKPVDDPTFGKVDIYDANMTMLIDLTTLGKTNQDVSLSVVSQGCAAVGVCFPPQKQTFNLKYQPNAIIKGQWVEPRNPEADSAISFGTSGLTSAFPTNTAPARAAKPL